MREKGQVRSVRLPEQIDFIAEAIKDKLNINRSELYSLAITELILNLPETFIFKGYDLKRLAELSQTRALRNHSKLERAEHISKTLFMNRVENDIIKLLLHNRKEKEIYKLILIYKKEAFRYNDKDLVNEFKKFQDKIRDHGFGFLKIKAYKKYQQANISKKLELDNKRKK